MRQVPPILTRAPQSKLLASLKAILQCSIEGSAPPLAMLSLHRLSLPNVGIGMLKPFAFGSAKNVWIQLSFLVDGSSPSQKCSALNHPASSAAQFEISLKNHVGPNEFCLRILAIA